MATRRRLRSVIAFKVAVQTSVNKTASLIVVCKTVPLPPCRMKGYHLHIAPEENSASLESTYPSLEFVDGVDRQRHSFSGHRNHQVEKASLLQDAACGRI